MFLIQCVSKTKSIFGSWPYPVLTELAVDWPNCDDVDLPVSEWWFCQSS